MRVTEAIQVMAAVGRETARATDEQQLIEALGAGLGVLRAQGLSLGVLHGDSLNILSRGFDDDLGSGYAGPPGRIVMPGPDSARSERVLYFTDVVSTPRRCPAGEEMLETSRYQSAACLPLRYPGGSYGYLAVHYTARPHLSKTDEAMLELMATATSGALARLAPAPRTDNGVPECAGPPAPHPAPAPVPVPVSASASDEGLVSLSPREEQVLTAIMAGLSNAEIAEDMHLSINSIKSYVRVAYRKIGVETRTQAVLWGAHHGLLRDALDAED